MIAVEAYGLRKNLSYGNGTSMALLYDLLFIIILSQTSSSEMLKIIFILIYFVVKFSGILIIATLVIKPLRKIMTELSALLKNIVRVGIPNSKIRDSILKAHDIDIDIKPKNL